MIQQGQKGRNPANWPFVVLPAHMRKLIFHRVGEIQLLSGKATDWRIYLVANINLCEASST